MTTSMSFGTLYMVNGCLWNHCSVSAIVVFLSSLASALTSEWLIQFWRNIKWVDRGDRTRNPDFILGITYSILMYHIWYSQTEKNKNYNIEFFTCLHLLLYCWMYMALDQNSVKDNTYVYFLLKKSITFIWVRKVYSRQCVQEIRKFSKLINLNALL